MQFLLASQRNRTLLALLALAVLVCAANLWKPYHVDDAAHLIIAQWIADNPFHPMSGALNWVGVDEPIHRTNQPHLFFYLMAGWGKLFGWSEVAQHGLLALASIACILFMFRLSRRVVPEHALWATALLVLSPAFIVSQNMMVDVPLLACWLWFFDSLAGIREDSRRSKPYLMAAVAVSCAVLIKYSSLVLLPILVSVILWDRRWRMLAVVAVPLIALVVWSLFNLADYGGVHMLQRSGGSPDLLRPLKFAIAWLLILGGVTPIGLAWAASMPRLRNWGIAAAAISGLALVVAAILVALSILPDTAADPLLWVLFAVNGALTAAALALAAWAALNTRQTHVKVAGDRRLLLMLLIWIAGGAGFYILLAPFSAVRHVLTIVPAVILLACFTVRETLTGRTKLIALACSLAVSGGLAVSDFRYAQFYKLGAERVARELPAATDSGPMVWTSGHWGWQWYAGQYGFRQIDYRVSRPAAGDFFVEAVGVDKQFPKEQLDLELVRSIIQPPSVWSLFCTARPRRFYMSSSRYGPWSLSMDCTQRIDIYRVRGGPYASDLDRSG